MTTFLIGGMKEEGGSVNYDVFAGYSFMLLLIKRTTNLSEELSLSLLTELEQDWLCADGQLNQMILFC